MSSADTGNNIMVVVMLPNNIQYTWAWPRVFPAIHMAHERVMKGGLLQGYTINLLNVSTGGPDGHCSETIAPMTAVDARTDYKADVFFGPGCIYSLTVVGKFASAWELPILTAGGSAVSAIKIRPWFEPIASKIEHFAGCLHLQLHQTNHASVIFYDLKTDDRPYYFQCESIYMTL